MKPVPKLTVTRIFHFDAAHHLTSYHGKCERTHGHTYRVDVSIKGCVGKEGLVLDFLILKDIVNRKVITFLDHTDLNLQFSQPSAENIAIWIWDQIQDDIQQLGVELKEVRVYETPSNFVSYQGGE